MENKVLEMLIDMKQDIKEEFKTFNERFDTIDERFDTIDERLITFKEEFNTLHKRIDGLENQTLNGFRELKLHVDNRSKEKELMIDFMQDKITELERKYFELSKRVEN